MTISYHDGRTRPAPGLATALMFLDAALVLVVVLGWPMLAEALGAPIEWAMSAGTGSVFDLRAYPYTVLWLLPMAGSVLGAIGLRLEMWLLARIATGFPVLLLGLVYGWYYLTPLAWH